jgi:hypothetical protein
MGDSEVNREDLNVFLYLCKAKTKTPQVKSTCLKVKMWSEMLIRTKCRRMKTSCIVIDNNND